MKKAATELAAMLARQAELLKQMGAAREAAALERESRQFRFLAQIS